jgi:hypothetical protein
LRGSSNWRDHRLRRPARRRRRRRPCHRGSSRSLRPSRRTRPPHSRLGMLRPQRPSGSSRLATRDGLMLSGRGTQARRGRSPHGTGTRRRVRHRGR